MLGFIKKKPALASVAPAPELEVREITRSADEALKKLLCEHEKVHPVTLDQLNGSRLAPDAKPGLIYDKHCYGLFVKGEKAPRNFIYAQFLHIEPDASGNISNADLPGNIGDMLRSPVRAVEKPNTVVFYSVSAVEEAHSKPQVKGGGAKLIGKVVKEQLKPLGIQAFVTLSPTRSGMGKGARGFAQWLDEHDMKAGAGHAIFTHEEKQKLVEYTGDSHASPVANLKRLHERQQELTENKSSLSPKKLAFLTTLMEDLATYYVAHERRNEKGRAVPRDKVTGFHIGNGAELAQVHYLPHGQAAKADRLGSMGMMVNYRYYPAHLSARRTNYKETDIIRMSPKLAERYEARCRKLLVPLQLVPTAEAAALHVPQKHVWRMDESAVIAPIRTREAALPAIQVNDGEHRGVGMGAPAPQQGVQLQ